MSSAESSFAKLNTTGANIAQANHCIQRSVYNQVRNTSSGDTQGKYLQRAAMLS